MMKNKLLVVAIISLLLYSCSDDLGYDFERFTVASEKRYMDFVGHWADGYVVSTRGNGEWSYFPHEITGFEYEQGKEYLLHLRVDKAKTPDGKSYKKYSLRRMVSEKVKASVGLPTDERGAFVVASEMRMSGTAGDKKIYYAVKFDGAAEWTMVEDVLMVATFDKGFEYSADYLKSNISGDNTMDKSNNFYRMINVVSKVEKTSEGLPGVPVPK